MSIYSMLLQVHKAQDIGSKRGKLSVEDFLYLIRKVSNLFTIFTNKLHFPINVLWLHVVSRHTIQQEKNRGTQMHHRGTVFQMACRLQVHAGYAGLIYLIQILYTIPISHCVPQLTAFIDVVIFLSMVRKNLHENNFPFLFQFQYQIRRKAFYFFLFSSPTLFIPLCFRQKITLASGKNSQISPYYFVV